MKDPGPNFVKSQVGRRLVYLDRQLAPFAPALMVEIDRQLRSGAKGAGNKSSGYPVNVDGAPALFVRRSRRGGLMSFLGEIYIGFIPRMIYELTVISEALKRGVPVVEPMGAIIENVAPAVYRGAIITKAVPGMTFWEFVQNETDPRSLSHVVRMARYSIDIMHEHGIFHDDLNMQNLFVSMAGDGFSVVILDFDKARVHSQALSKGQRKKNFKRLAQSIRKLDPEGKYLNDASLKILTAT